jgi:hypothetical protein
MHSRSERLPKGRSHVVKAATLAAAVEVAGISIPVKLTNWDRFDYAFQADFLPNGFPVQDEHELIWVHCRAVPAHRAEEARLAVEHEAIPRFIRWARDLDAMDACSTVRREKQAFRYSLEHFST